MSVAAPESTNRAGKYRPADDFYSTPVEAARPFISAVEPYLRGRTIWEPACGAGALSMELLRAGHNVFSSNLNDRQYGTPGVDFLSQQVSRGECIITNPPFSLCTEFALHAVNLGVNFVGLFARTKFLEGAKRYDALLKPHPPTFVYQFVERIKFFAGDTAREDQPGWNTEAFAWFVWVKDDPRETTVRWLRRGA